jgi:hypothetical protein
MPRNCLGQLAKDDIIMGQGVKDVFAENAELLRLLPLRSGDPQCMRGITEEFLCKRD